MTLVCKTLQKSTHKPKGFVTTGLLKVPELIVMTYVRIRYNNSKLKKKEIEVEVVVVVVLVVWFSSTCDTVGAS